MIPAEIVPRNSFNRRTLLATGVQTISIGLLSPGPVHAASDPVVETAQGRLRGIAEPGVAVLFDWQTPVYNGVLRSPHTIEVPFVFGTTQAAAAAEVGMAAILAP